jgi:WD40 repeat protein
LWWWPGALGGELGILLGGSVGGTVAALSCGILGIAFSEVVGLTDTSLVKSRQEAAMGIHRPFMDRVVVRQPWDWLRLLALLAVAVATPYWVLWHVGAPGSPLGDFPNKGPYPVKGPITSVALSPNGRMARAGALDGSLISMRLQGAAGTPTSWQFAGSRWRLNNGRVSSLAFSSDSKRALSAHEVRGLLVSDVSTGQYIPLCQIQTGTVICAAFAPDGQTILTGSAGDVDPVIQLWDIASGKALWRRALVGHRAPVRVLAFASSGGRVLSASDDGTIRLWDVASGLQIRRIKGYNSPVLSIAISPDGSQALSGHEDGNVRVWDLDNEEELNRLGRHRDQVTAVAFAADGRTAFSGSRDGTARRWDPQTGRQLGICHGSADVSVECLAASPDGLTVLVGGSSGIVQLWGWPAKTETLP